MLFWDGFAATGYCKITSKIRGTEPTFSNAILSIVFIKKAISKATLNFQLYTSHKLLNQIKMNETMIRDAYCKIRTIDQTIPDDVLDFMFNAAIEKIQGVSEDNEFRVYSKRHIKRTVETLLRKMMPKEKKIADRPGKTIEDASLWGQDVQQERERQIYLRAIDELDDNLEMLLPGFY
jgi:hypothetical protein